ncbi:9008_t:CDS:2, partial [Funneliformis geosporum]
MQTKLETSVQILMIDEVGEIYNAVRMARSSASVDEGELRRSVALKAMGGY